MDVSDPIFFKEVVVGAEFLYLDQHWHKSDQGVAHVLDEDGSARAFELDTVVYRPRVGRTISTD